MKHYRVVIAGGGIVGASIARDCALRGIKDVLLVDKSGIGQATTAASTGLANRGLRYINYDIVLTRISAQETAVLQFIAPHLLSAKRFLIPFFNDSKFHIEIFESALEAYEAVVEKYGAPRHEKLSKQATLETEPLLSPNVSGSLAIEEMLLSDSQFARESAEHAELLGAEVLENWEARSIEKSGSGYLVNLKSADGDKTVSADLLCNATGPWAQQFAAKLNCRVALRPTKGVHIILQGIPLSANLIILDTIDRRYPLTVIDKTGTGSIYVGPTDEDFFGSEFDPSRLTCAEDEVGFLLNALQRAVPQAGRHHVTGFIKGIRPTLFQHGVQPERLSRNFKIYDHQEDGFPGFISVAGGKLTIARLMAERVTDLICKKLNLDKTCVTHLVPLPKCGDCRRRPIVTSLQTGGAFSQSASVLASGKKRIVAVGRLGWYFAKHCAKNPRSLQALIAQIKNLC